MSEHVRSTDKSNQFFVRENSIVRQIWGKSDTILLIFAGASAEFALNKAADWLYFTGRLPKDPIGRLFSTVSYARSIVFSEQQAARHTIQKMATIHANVESKRGYAIPEWAYRDVLFMLIDYSIRSFELLERSMTAAEKNEVLDVFHRLGSEMGVTGLPNTFTDWQVMRESHMNENLVQSVYTEDLYRQYRKHLGGFRYRILREAQTLIVPSLVRHWLGLRDSSWLAPLVTIYKVTRRVKLDHLVKSFLFPPKYKREIGSLDLITHGA